METPNSTESAPPPAADPSSAVRALSLSGLQLERLSAALAGQFAVLYDVGNMLDPCLSVAGDMLSFTFREGFSKKDEDLLASGRGNELREFREHFLLATSEEMNEVVESVIPAARVAFFSAAFDTASRLTYCFFVLDWSADAEREQRLAIRAWSEQVRLHARKLRVRSSHAMEANVPLTQGYAELRRTSDRG
jgi:hypothetical protein